MQVSSLQVVPAFLVPSMHSPTCSSSIPAGRLAGVPAWGRAVGLCVSVLGSKESTSPSRFASFIREYHKKRIPSTLQMCQQERGLQDCACIFSCMMKLKVREIAGKSLASQPPAQTSLPLVGKLTLFPGILQDVPLNLWVASMGLGSTVLMTALE